MIFNSNDMTLAQQKLILEICVDSIESACAAERGGADRVELCSALIDGGLTPSTGLLTLARSKLAIDVFVMIRPRGGDFCYSEDEFEQMKEDIRVARNLGADGIVLGLLDTEGKVDVDRTQALVELAAPLPVTFHRAFDMTVDPGEALPAVIATGARRILTSGGEPDVIAGMPLIAELVAMAGDAISIMPGSGIRPENIAHLAESTRAHEFHSSARATYSSPMAFRKQGIELSDVPGSAFVRYATQEKIVRRLADALHSNRLAGACAPS